MSEGRRIEDLRFDLAALLLGQDGAFITGTDLLIDGGVIAALHAGRITLAGELS